jgi:subtilisin family serine protease
MKFNQFLILATLLLNIPSFAQTTYFIKYKSSVPINVVESNISQQVFSNNLGDAPLALPIYKLDYLAKGLGRGDEVLGRIVKVQFSENVDEANFNSILSSDPDIEYIQKSTTYQLDFVPNDSLISEQWALLKIKAFDAWDITTGADTVLLAIIDTGIEYFHPDLKNKIYKNPGEMGIDNLGRDKSNNEIDDDANGFIDDYMGWDFVDRVGFPLDTTAGDYLNWDNYPYDPVHGLAGFHGTFVAGIAGAEANNISGIAGVAPYIKLLNLRAFENGGGGEEDDVASAILYAVQMGVKVINMSFGDYSFSYVLRDVIRYAYTKNVVLVASSGNQNVNTPHYPSGYSEVISVGNSTEQDYVASNSSWGSTLDLVAPGTSIISTSVESTYITAGGTSASAPFVSATAALILSLQNFTNEEVKQIIKSTTDDIGETGWDIKSGAGRLNMESALRVLAPSNIKFSFPLMDFATSEDSIPIVATVLSANFISYNLEVGEGIDPENWTPLIDIGLNQFSEKEIYNLDISSYEEGTYTLRLTVNTNTGRTMEERVLFHIMRTAPKVAEVGLGSIYYGDRSTIAGEFYTSQPSVMRMYYRTYGGSNFDFITLDGFNTNNQFVKQLHYGFIPKELVLPSTLYEIYFEAENLAGLKTVIVDSLNNNDNFLIRTEDVPSLTEYYEMPFSMPYSNLWDEPVSFLSDNYTEILNELFYESQIPYFGLYKLEDNNFVKIDSIESKFPRAFGDFNNDGKKDFISFKSPDIIIDEQSVPYSFNLIEKYRSPSLENVINVEDLDGDGSFEIISQKGFSSYQINKIKQSLEVDTSKVVFYKTYSDTLDSDKYSEINNLINNNLLVIDSDNDGKKEIWFVDADGDLISYKVNDLNNIVKGDSLRVIGLTTIKDNILSSGDYNGDGKKDFAVLYETNSIAPSFLLLIVTFQNHIPKILVQKVFLDQSAEYSGGLSFNDVYQTLRFVDINNDNNDELILSIFPFVYIFKYSDEKDNIVFYQEGSNSYRIFKGDLNQNGVPEIALTINDKIKFFEFTNSIVTDVPQLFRGYSLSSNKIQLSWSGNAERYYIYKGLDASNLELIDSLIFEPSYLDLNVQKNITYYYTVKAFDPIKPAPLSGFSKVIEVYSHTPAKPDTAISNSNRSVIVTFSEKMKNTIENLQSFEIVDTIGYPNSITASDQYSYLLSFNQNLPAGEQKVIIKNIKDFYNAPIEKDTLIFNVTPVLEEPSFFVSNFEIINAYKIKLSFNYPVDGVSAMNLNNYIFEPSNKVTSVTIDPNDSKIVYLDLSNQKPIGSIGKEYILRINNLISNVASGNIPINTGAGSYVVLSKYAKDLSDVYVYPNPTKEGTEKITFANLPQRAKISIWTIDGILINEFEETDGNGGVDYDLTDLSGNHISSGIYFYRIVQLDETRNESEEKLGKFAIVR